MKIFFKLVSISILLITSLSASKSDQLNGDSTVLKSSRMTVLTIPELILETNKINIPITFCQKTINSKGEIANDGCSSNGRYKERLSNSFVSQKFQNNLSFVVSNSVDKISFENNKAVIQTGSTSEKVAISQNLNLNNFIKSNNKNFKNSVLSQLNSKIAPFLSQIISSVEKAKYQENSDRERISFLETQAKESGVPLEIFLRMMNSNFAFGFYMPKITGNFTVTKTKNLKQKSVGYSLDLSLNMKLYLNVYQFNNDKNKYTIKKSILVEKDFSDSASNMLFDFLGDQLNEALGGIFTGGSPNYPTDTDFAKSFEDKFNSLLKEIMIATKIKLKRQVPEFKLKAPLTSKNRFTLGTNEDIRVDQPFILQRNKNGKFKDIGLAKVDEVGTTCLNLSEEKRTESKLSIISGSPEAFDLAIEHPWSGVFFNLGGGIETNHIELTRNEETFDIGGASSKFISLGYYGDLGYVLNSEALSEWWLNLAFNYGIIQDLQDYSQTNYSKFTGDMDIKFILEIEKRLYLISRLYFALGSSFGYGLQSYTSSALDGYSDDLKISITYGYIEPFIKTGITISPDFEIFARAGYGLPITTEVKFEVGDEEFITEDELSLTSGLTVMFGLKYGVDFTGLFSILRGEESSLSCK